MRLIKVYSNKKSFREVNFNENGLSLIIAKQKDANISEKGQTYNGVGKSLLVRIIHFCLGAKKENYKEFCEKLHGWEFYLDFKISDISYTSKRTTDNPSRIVLNDKELTIQKFNKSMERLCFHIPDDISYLSFRSLIYFFIRGNKKSYVSYKKPGSVHTEYQSLLYNGFLFGLDVFLIQKKKQIKIEKDRIKGLETNFNKDLLLKEFFTGNKDVTLTLLDLEEQIKELDENLDDFKVAEDYNDIQVKADEVERELFDLNNTIISLKNNIENIETGLNIKPDVSKEDIKEIYKEANVYFNDSITKRLEELENFYIKLITNRKKRLLEQRNRIEGEMEEKSHKADQLKKEFDKLMQYLGEHQALDVYVSVSNKRAKLKSEKESLEKYQNLQAEYKEKRREADRSRMNLVETAEQYLNDIETDIAGPVNYFRNLAKTFYPDVVAGLSFEVNDKDNQLLFDIDAKVDCDSSDGINNVKIFCYDLTIIFKGQKHSINFIFHDSRLFDGIDERQKADMFRVVHKEFFNTNKQYIATVNQNQINEVKSQFSDQEFQKIIKENTILTLTDESDSKKLLGIKIDIRED